MKRKTIASEIFSAGDKYYFLDYRIALNGTYYLRITRMDKSPEGFSRRRSVVIFEEDLAFFIQALSSLLHHAAYSTGRDTDG